MANSDRYTTVVAQELLSFDDPAKRYPTGASIIELLGELKKRGTRIIIDVCDNHFYHERRDERWLRANDVFRRMADFADEFVFSTDELARQMQHHLGNVGAYRVIGDLVESDSDFDEAPLLRRWLGPRRLLARVSEMRLRATLAANRRRGIANLVWFGFAGSSIATGGMDSLSRVREVLEETSKSARPLELTVISNSRKKYESITRGWQIPSRFAEWDRTTFARILRAHDICIIPIERNPFTNCKSSNRIVTAMNGGLPVVADSVPSFLEFSDCVAFDDWPAGLRRYLTAPELAKRDVLRGRQRIERTWSRERIGRKWFELLAAVPGA